MLVHGLSEAMMTTREWLTPGAIEELCLGASRADQAAELADQAWGWVLDYLRLHGVSGEVKRGPVLPFNSARQGLQFGPDVPAPAVPAAIAGALCAIGGTVRDGLRRVGSADGECLPYVKKEFAAAFGRARRLGCD